MRHRMYGGWLFAITALLSTLSSAQAQVTDYAVPGLPQNNVPIPTGNPGGHGVYTFGEFLILTQTWTVGKQTVAYRGLVDSRGLITGLPGTYIGSGAEALNTGDFARRTWQPGFSVGFGYKSAQWQVAAAYQHAFAVERTARGTPASLIGETADGRYRNPIDGVAISLGYRF